MKNSDVFYMQEALRLAKRGLNFTFPNPLVGAVLVKQGKIIGKGYHRKVGMPHAEIEAFSSATEDPKGATLYVTLEPCSHHGRTPPCAEAIIQKSITKVVCAVEDPHLKVHGKGIKLLKEAGIVVEIGLLQDKAAQLNEGFFTFHTQKRPFVAIKFAASLDGKIATKTGDSKWITSERTRLYARKLRAEYQAILVGINTVLHDNPHLGVRQKGKKDPLRIILDSTLKIPLASEVLRDRNVLIVTTVAADQKKKKMLKEKGIEILEFAQSTISITNLLQSLRKKEIVSVFVEGGSSVIGSFIDAKLVDRVYAFYAPIFIGGKEGISSVGGAGIEKITEALHVRNIRIKKFANEYLVSGDI